MFSLRSSVPLDRLTLLCLPLSLSALFSEGCLELILDDELLFGSVLPAPELPPRLFPTFTFDSQVNASMCAATLFPVTAPRLIVPPRFRVFGVEGIAMGAAPVSVFSAGVARVDEPECGWVMRLGVRGGAPARTSARMPRLPTGADSMGMNCLF